MLASTKFCVLLLLSSALIVGCSDDDGDLDAAESAESEKDGDGDQDDDKKTSAKDSGSAKSGKSDSDADDDDKTTDEDDEDGSDKSVSDDSDDADDADADDADADDADADDADADDADADDADADDAEPAGAGQMPVDEPGDEPAAGGTGGGMAPSFPTGNGPGGMMAGPGQGFPGFGRPGGDGTGGGMATGMGPGGPATDRCDDAIEPAASCGDEMCDEPGGFAAFTCTVPCCVESEGRQVCGTRTAVSGEVTECVAPPVEDPRCPDVELQFMTDTVMPGCCTSDNLCGAISPTGTRCITDSPLGDFPENPVACDAAPAEQAPAAAAPVDSDAGMPMTP